ncbi:MAG: flagellar assembly protein FliW [Spirochaetaceae bacterium]|jgi:flagellar assembly factor FliW|nr:flagellar assembly protein FliW [Spirochaetaceae bacterium]
MEIITKINAKDGGTVTIAEKQRFVFPEGLFGFEEFTDYALINSDYEPFLWFQSLQEPALAFLVVDPFVIRPDYEADIDDLSLGKIGITSPSQVLVLAILTVPPPPAPVTVNLQGPLVINKASNICLQAVLSDERWTTRHTVTGGTAPC